MSFSSPLALKFIQNIQCKIACDSVTGCQCRDRRTDKEKPGSKRVRMRERERQRDINEINKFEVKGGEIIMYDMGMKICCKSHFRLHLLSTIHKLNDTHYNRMMVVSWANIAFIAFIAQQNKKTK